MENVREMMEWVRMRYYVMIFWIRIGGRSYKDERKRW